MPIERMLPADLSVSSVTDPSMARIVATSRLLAAQANDEEGDPSLGIPGVRDFRRIQLPEGRLLSPGAIENWIAEQAAQDGAPSLWIVGVPIQPDDLTLDNGGYLTLRIREPQVGTPLPDSVKEAPSWDYRWLEFSTPTLKRVRERVRAGAVLDQLRRLALLLSDAYLWNRAQATTFALTGLVPYSDAFVRWLEKKRGRRPREMTYKHLELAVFTQLHTGQTLAARMAQWNAANPKWAYRTVEHFGGDSRLAVRRLIEAGAIPDGNEETWQR
jgi:hypothetical protein